jgi:hypothetical protein
VTGGGSAVEVLQRKATAIVNVARVIATVQYHFLVAVGSAKGAKSNGAQVGGIMTKPPGVTITSKRSSANWFSAISVAAFLTKICTPATLK